MLQLLLRRVVELPNSILDALELLAVVVIEPVEVDCAHFIYLDELSLGPNNKIYIAGLDAMVYHTEGNCGGGRS